jgi:hypothetical protein
VLVYLYTSHVDSLFRSDKVEECTSWIYERPVLRHVFDRIASIEGKIELAHSGKDEEGSCMTKSPSLEMSASQCW